jgi:hypothetical protein
MIVENLLGSTEEVVRRSDQSQGSHREKGDEREGKVTSVGWKESMIGK